MGDMDSDNGIFFAWVGEKVTEGFWTGKGDNIWYNAVFDIADICFSE